MKADALASAVFRSRGQRLEIGTISKRSIDAGWNWRLLDLVGQFLAAASVSPAARIAILQHLQEPVGRTSPCRLVDLRRRGDALQGSRQAFPDGQAVLKPAEVAEVPGPDPKHDQEDEQAQERQSNAPSCFRICGHCVSLSSRCPAQGGRISVDYRQILFRWLELVRIC